MKDTNWSQRAAHKSHNIPTDKQRSPRAGSLLSSYGKSPSQYEQAFAPGQVSGEDVAALQQPGPDDDVPVHPRHEVQSRYDAVTTSSLTPSVQSTQLVPRLQSLSGRAGNSQNPLLSQSQHFFSNTITAVRRWSGKMATIAGYNLAPPAPYMERYHPAQAVIAAVQLPVKRWKRSRTLRVAWQMRQRRERWEQVRPRFSRQLLCILLLLIAILTVGSIAGTLYGYAYYHSQLPRLQELAHQRISQTTRIYDRHGTLLYEFFTDHRRTPVAYTDVPQAMRDAMIAAEDKTFWSNSGIDPQGILRAALAFWNAGSVQGGGSTLTQQVVKNLTDDTEQTFNRKLPEAAMALGLTQQYPKAKILEMYFNVAPFNNSDFGIEAAVEDYFHLMPLCDAHFKCIPGIARLNYNTNTGRYDPLLGLARASLLAGMPQNPSAYDPTLGYYHKQAALVRQVYVLDQMAAMNVIVPGLGPVTPALEKRVEKLTARMLFRPLNVAKLAPHFVDWIISQLATALGNGNYSDGYAALATGGFNIRTTIDLRLENYVEQAVKRHLTEPEYQPFIDDYGPLNTLHNVNDSAVVVLNTHTGEILAMNGSSDYNSTDPRVGGYYNAAAGGAGRPVGSSFKPFVYATAFQMGWYPGIVLPDNLTYVPNGAAPGVPVRNMYEPPDYGSETNHQEMNTTIRRATAVSWNIAAVKTGAFVGATTLLTNVRRMGLTHIKDTHASWVLGTNNATVLEMTGAYQTFANGGTHIPPQGILDIWDNYGHNLYHYDPTHPPEVSVFSPQVAYLMTSVLMDQPSRSAEFLNDYVLSFADVDASCINLKACPQQVAAKTGTTDAMLNGKDVIPDNWTVGYTPDVAVGVWSGNANNAPMQGVIGVTGAAPIWHSVISTVAGHCPQDVLLPCPNITPQDLGLEQQTTFPVPGEVIPNQCTSPINGLAPGGIFFDASMHCDWMINGQMPQQTGLPFVNLPAATPTAQPNTGTTKPSSSTPIPDGTSKPGSGGTTGGQPVPPISGGTNSSGQPSQPTPINPG